MFCSFCNNEIPKGTGEIYVLRDGTTLNFCSSKCKANQVELRREGRRVGWTNKGLILSSEKKAEEKKDSALAKEIEAKLAEKKAPAKK
ncbi:50S ribosomal protein L24e [uncultured archaeon]|nr:50S ribosomal protein L24e [uncultured archaeon]